MPVVAYAVLLVPLAMLACSVFILMRSNAVYRFRTTLLHEEKSWLMANLIALSNANVQEVFRRYKSASGYGHMVLQFWKPLKPEAWGLKPIEDYYPEIQPTYAWRN